MKSITFRFIALVIFSIASFASGHGFAETLEEIVGDYTIEVGFDTADLVADQPVRMDFILWNSKIGAMQEFTHTWVRIALAAKGTLFDGNLYHQPEFSSAGITYLFSEVGDHILTVRFQNKDNIIAETSFPLKVKSGTEINPLFALSNFLRMEMLLPSLLLLFIIMGWFLMEKLQRTSK